jgi:hypothetical protein
MRAFSIGAIVSLTMVCTAQADQLRIMNWNIANLAAEAGMSLRPGSHVRTEDDFNRLREIITAYDPDILTLQEIGSEAAAQNILGPTYDVELEFRCEDDGCGTDQDDIFTALAWKTDLDLNVDVFDVEELAVLHQSECSNEEPRLLRGGIGMRFFHEGVPYSILSVHLKASCADEDSHDAQARPNVQDDCRALTAQMGALAFWMHGEINAGNTVIVGGDFNRKFLEGNDRFAPFLREAVPGLRFEPDEQSQCWPRNYPQSRGFRTRQLNQTFGSPGEGLRWSPYMPSSIGSRDFFLIAGPAASNVGTGHEILMRPERPVHDTSEGGLNLDQWIAVEAEAARFGVRFSEPTGFIAQCEPDQNGNPIPQPFTTGPVVLGFQNVFPSDHCPITIEIEP